MIEYFDMLHVYNNLLKNKRGYISKISEPKIAVMLFSGGIDSIITTARMIEDFGFEIFPLYFRRKKINIGEEKSIEFFNDYYLKRYKNLFHKLNIVDLDSPPSQWLDNLQAYKEKSKKIDFEPFENVMRYGYPLRDNIFNCFAVQYAVAMSYRHNKVIKTIFNGLIDSDNYLHGNILSMRTNTIMTCQSMDDWEWQIISPNIDLEFNNNFLFNKKDEILWSIKHNIPLEYSISCWHPVLDKNNNLLCCGCCDGCLGRKEIYESMNLTDKILYINN
ncbi:MAG TPA: 7-cyano-7-deazaguanine synthase [Rickettsiales bacterium]|nr:7-cyano-7-deazaguanine synthase [Rickettsiales bacterium]